MPLTFTETPDPLQLLRLLKGAPLSCLVTLLTQTHRALTPKRLALLTGYDIIEVYQALDLLQAYGYVVVMPLHRWKPGSSVTDTIDSPPPPNPHPKPCPQPPTFSLN